MLSFTMFVIRKQKIKLCKTKIILKYCEKILQKRIKERNVTLIELDSTMINWFLYSQNFLICGSILFKREFNKNGNQMTQPAVNYFTFSQIVDSPKN